MNLDLDIEERRKEDVRLEFRILLQSITPNNLEQTEQMCNKIEELVTKYPWLEEELDKIIENWPQREDLKPLYERLKSLGWL